MYVLLLWRKERDELPEGMYNQRGGGGGDGEGDEERDEFPEGDGLRLRLRLRGERGAQGDGLRLRLRLRLRLLAMGCVCRLPGSSGFSSSASKRSRRALSEKYGLGRGWGGKKKKEAYLRACVVDDCKDLKEKV